MKNFYSLNNGFSCILNFSKKKKTIYFKTIKLFKFILIRFKVKDFNAWNLKLTKVNFYSQQQKKKKINIDNNNS